MTHISTSLDNIDLHVAKCDPDGKFAMVVHGWKENCYDEPWILELFENLKEFRGGCIICMDYYKYSRLGYGGLAPKFDSIATVLTKKLKLLHDEGMKYENLFMWGFSFGGQLIVEAGRRIGNQSIDSIDTCDMAGPAFDGNRLYGRVDRRIAAKNVQCIHTSIDKGTRFTNTCHQNWKMGQCGMRQIGAQRPPLGSHGLCPIFYNSAFRNDFVAIPKRLVCPVGPLEMFRKPNYPKGYKMGYMESDKS